MKGRICLSRCDGISVSISLRCSLKKQINTKLLILKKKMRCCVKIVILLCIHK